MPFRLHFHVLYRILCRIQYTTGKTKKQDEEREFLGHFAKSAYPRASPKRGAARPLLRARGKKNTSHNKKRTTSRVVRLLF